MFSPLHPNPPSFVLFSHLLLISGFGISDASTSPLSRLFAMDMVLPASSQLYCSGPSTFASVVCHPSDSLETPSWRPPGGPILVRRIFQFFLLAWRWRLHSSFNIFFCLLGFLGAVFPWVLRGPPPRPPPLRLPRPCCCCCCCCWCCCCRRSRGSSGFLSRFPPPLGAVAALHPALLCVWVAPPGAPSPRFLATTSHPVFFPTPPRRLGLLAPATWIGYRGGLHFSCRGGLPGEAAVALLLIFLRDVSRLGLRRVAPLALPAPHGRRGRGANLRE